MPAVPELTPTEFCERWPDPARSSQVTLLDVREHDELELAAIDGALHIPMRDVPARLAELDRDAPLVVMCHSGGRSRRVAEFLANNGFQQVFNLRGGIDAWSTEIDPQVPRY
ncbi:MAG TPA: rhodanese-like domain-containing protein [Gammaproteobacteria bacterium]|nr:rhodanese-like domain-containing protein [Gammaproteobacteria bacterium]